MLRIGLIREEKTPPDTRVALTPEQCAAILADHPGVSLVVQPSDSRCFKDEEYAAKGIVLQEDLSDCDILLGIKEAKIASLLAGKTYFFFSHTKKAQPYNRGLMRALIGKGIRMIDYECLTHADGQRILGFGFFAGLVGAHNGLRTWGKRFGRFDFPPAHYLGSFKALRQLYSDTKLPNIKIVVTGSGKVASGVLEIMQLLDVDYIEPQDFLAHDYEYPVYTHLKGATLYVRKDGGPYHRDDFHHHPEAYECIFEPYLKGGDVLMNGVYWDKHLPRLFSKDAIRSDDLRMHVMADITCDVDGSVVINSGPSTIADPVYGIDRGTLERADPFLNNPKTIDLMAVDNLPNELPRDASEHFGIHWAKYILPELLQEKSAILDRATLCTNGKLTAAYEYLSDYAYGDGSL